MKLTLKDKAFLERLRALLDSKDLFIELKNDGLKRLILRQNYGDQIESAFGLTRQGVRWRFQRSTVRRCGIGTPTCSAWSNPAK